MSYMYYIRVREPRKQVYYLVQDRKTGGEFSFVRDTEYQRGKVDCRHFYPSQRTVAMRWAKEVAENTNYRIVELVKEY